MMFKSTDVALLLLFAPCCLAVWGVPPGARGTIDFRYPDYIVEPRPPCPSEGVFPHPRNCSWYYRCHDPYSVGFFHQNYFECEPGTVFADALDQCVHPFNPEYPCDPAAPAVTTASTTLWTAPPTTTSTTTTTTTTPKPPPFVPDCHDSMIRCKMYICFDENNVVGAIGRLCQSAFSMCQNGSQISYCQSDQYFDVLTRTCVTPPGTRNCVDEDVFDSTASPPPFPVNLTPTPTPTPTPTTSVAPPDDCYDSMVECKYYVCATTAAKEYLCKKAFRTCNFSQLTFYCGNQHYFNYGTRGCVDPPSARGCVELASDTPTVATTTLPPTTAIMIDPSLLTFTFTVECSVENPRPKEPKLAQYYCSNYPMCRREQDSHIELCLKYLQCTRSRDEWKAVVMECPRGLFFSYEKDSCIRKPDNVCKKKKKKV